MDIWRISNSEMRIFAQGQKNQTRGGIRGYAAQAIAPIDAEIGQKGHLWI
jgi:hypothetical protein